MDISTEEEDNTDAEISNNFHSGMAAADGSTSGTTSAFSSSSSSSLQRASLHRKVKKEPSTFDYSTLFRIKQEDRDIIFIKDEPVDEPQSFNSKKSHLGVYGTRTRAYKQKVSYTMGTGMEDEDDQGAEEEDDDGDGDFNGKDNKDEAEEETFEIESILDKKTDRKNKYYLVKWKGYSDQDNSWVHVRDMCCDELLKEFEKKNKK